MEKPIFEKQQLSREAEKEAVLELKPEEKEYLEELIQDIYKVEIEDSKYKKIEKTFKIVDKLIDAKAIKTALVFLDNIKEDEISSFEDEEDQAYLRDKKIAILLKIIDSQKQEDDTISNDELLKEIKQQMDKISDLGIYSFQISEKNLAKYALAIAEKDKERARELFGRVKDKTPYLKELLDLGWKDLIQKQMANGEMIKILLERGELDLAEKCAATPQDYKAVELVVNKLIEDGQYERAFSFLESSSIEEYRPLQKIMKMAMDKIIEKEKTKGVPDYYLERYIKFLKERVQKLIDYYKYEKKWSEDSCLKEARIINLETEMMIANTLTKLGKKQAAREILEKYYKNYQNLSLEDQLKLAFEIHFFGNKQKADKIAKKIEKLIVNGLNTDYHSNYPYVDALLEYHIKIGEISYALDLLEKILAIDVSKQNNIKGYEKDSVIDDAISVLIKQGHIEQAELLINKYGYEYKYEKWQHRNRKELFNELTGKTEEKQDSKKEIRPEILNVNILKNYLINQIKNPPPELTNYLFGKDDIYLILTRYAKFEEKYYKANRDNNQEIFDERLRLLYKKFGDLVFKLLDWSGFKFERDGQPSYINNEEFEKIINSLDENKVKIIFPYLEKGDLDRNYELKKLVFDYIFGPATNREIKKEKITVSLEKYFENIDITKIKKLRNKEPGLYYQYVIYRYLRFLKWRYKVKSFEELSQQLEKDKNERGFFLCKEFIRIKDKLPGEDEIKLGYLGKKKEVELHKDFYCNTEFEKFKIKMDRLEKEILDEAETVRNILDKVKELGKDNIVIVVPNRRMAWIYEHLLTDWQDDNSLFKNEQDKILFKLESALLSQEYPLKDQDIYLPLAIIKTAKEWLNKKKIDHFVYVFKGIKYSSTPSVRDVHTLWSIGHRTFRGPAQKDEGYIEPTKSIINRAALKEIAENFKDIPIVFIDITYKSAPGSFEKVQAHIPSWKRLHLISLKSGVFRDNIVELLGSSLWEALEYGHPNIEASWHDYLSPTKIKTTRGKMQIGKYYVERIREEIKQQEKQNRTKRNKK